MNIKSYVEDLYQNAVDKKDADYLANFLAQEVVFRIGNYPAVQGKEAVLVSNCEFFKSIDKMAHTIDEIVVNGETVFCYGKVDYVRLDSTTTSATFATVLKLSGTKITEYYVFADLSAL